MSERYLIISADTHAGLPSEDLLPFVHQRYDDLSVLGAKD